MPDQVTIREAYDYCDRIARQRARNFYPAFYFLSTPRRLALSAFYAFCSFSDDISDAGGNLTLAEKCAWLTSWRQSMECAFSGQPDGPVFTALSEAIKRFNLPRQPFFDLLSGIEMDLEPRAYLTFSELHTYCRRVASSVGLVSLSIFGCSDPGAEEYADNLGVAFQLTNILRDISEDLQRGRVYIPTEDLDRFSLSAYDLHQQKADDRFMQLMRFEYARAVSYFEKADPKLVGRQRRKLLTAEIMKAVYRRTLEELKRQHFLVFGRRIALTRSQKFCAITTALLRAAF